MFKFVVNSEHNFNCYFIISKFVCADRSEEVMYSGDLNTTLVWYLNGPKEVGCQMVWYLNAI